MKITEYKKILHPYLHKYIEEEIDTDKMSDDEKEKALEDGDDYEDEDYLDIPEEQADEVEDIINNTIEGLTDGLKSQYELTDDDVNQIIKDIIDPEIEKEVEKFDPDNLKENGEILDHVVDVFEIPEDFAEKIAESYNGDLKRSLRQISRYLLK